MKLSIEETAGKTGPVTKAEQIEGVLDAIATLTLLPDNSVSFVNENGLPWVLKCMEDRTTWSTTCSILGAVCQHGMSPVASAYDQPEPYSSPPAGTPTICGRDYMYAARPPGLPQGAKSSYGTHKHTQDSVQVRAQPLSLYAITKGTMCCGTGMLGKTCGGSKKQPPRGSWILW